MSIFTSCLVLAKLEGQDSPMQPKGFFLGRPWNNFIEQLKLILKWMLIERWRRPSMLSSMCQHVARLQFDSCAEKDSLCGTVMIHDGLNLTCLDQCHGVRSHGTSSSQSWRKRIVVQSKFDLWVYILVYIRVFMLQVKASPKLFVQMKNLWHQVIELQPPTEL